MALTPQHWTQSGAACELGINARALGRIIAEKSVKPVAKEKTRDQYLLADIHRAILESTAGSGTIEQEKLRKTKEEADKLSIENAKARGELIETAEASAVMERLATAVRTEILSEARLSKEVKNEIIINLKSAVLAVDE